jgi:hypothetical protein
MLSVNHAECHKKPIMLSVLMLNVVILGVIMPSVAAPTQTYHVFAFSTQNIKNTLPTVKFHLKGHTACSLAPNILHKLAHMNLPKVHHPSRDIHNCLFLKKTWQVDKSTLNIF